MSLLPGSMNSCMSYMTTQGNSRETPEALVLRLLNAAGGHAPSFFL